MGRSDFIPTRKTLLERLRNVDDSESWRAFYETYWGLIYSTAMKAGLKGFEAEEVVQETLIGVAKSMPTFRYNGAHGSFKSWLLKLTVWRISDQFRRRRTRGNARFALDMDPGDITEIPDLASTGLEREWEAEWERNLLDAAMRHVKLKANHKEYQIFDLAVLQEWPVLKISASLKVNPASIYRAKHRVAQLLKAEVEQLKSTYV
jgi:RNA polymerase sigma-70 factor (ECF subfamily)